MAPPTSRREASPPGVGPLPVLAAGLLLGILAHGDPASTARAPWSLPAAILTGLGVCGAGALARRGGAVLLLTAGALFGFARAAVERAGRVADAAWTSAAGVADGDLVKVYGAVVKTSLAPLPGRAGAPRGWRFLLGIERLEDRTRQALLDGAAWVYVDGDVPRAWIGARVEVVGEVRASRGEPRLRTRRGAVKPIAGPGPFDLDAALERLRYDAARTLERRLAGDALGTAVALVLGLYNEMSEASLRLHADTGALPFLAISGSHVVLVAAAAGTVAGRRRTRQARALGLTAVLIPYACLAGGSPPVARAAAGFCYILAGRALGRRADALSALSAGLTLELAFRPGEAFSAGLRLSYAAVLGYCFFLEDARRALFVGLTAAAPRFPRALCQALAATLAFAVVAYLSTAWLGVLHFGQTSPAAIPLSLPLTLLVPPMLLLGWGALLPEPLGPLAAAGFELFERAERAVVELAGALPGSPLPVSSGLTAAAAFAGLAPLLLLTGRARAAAVAALLAAAAAAARPSAPTGRLEVWLHACGHGLAATAILPDGSALQIDAGSRDVPDLARRRLRQALDDLGVRRFEAVSLSHADADHANAVAELLERYGASRVVCALENPWRDVLARRTLDVLIEEGALHRAGASAHWILVRAPTSASDNDRAIATVLEYAGRRVLFPADLERAGIAELLRRLPAGPIDVLVMPHHALENGQVEPLLDAVKPSIALASNGGRYSTRATEDFLARRGLRLRATRDHGTLRLRIAPDGSVLLTSMPPD